ncbi:MAG: branched-chain amino acid ABC transporter permease, partial [Deltaproteobacteria bacterium]|nr:branched-chain amino acid ABC transporter permease [Deltaproteobacteria bacterium]
RDMDQRKNFKRWLLCFIAAVMVGLILIGFYGSQYTLTLLYQFFIFLTLAASYDIVGGYMGYMNLGHCCFFGVGGYVFSILSDRGFAMIWAMLGGVVATAIFAILVAIPFFRLRGAYFALGNLGLILLMEMVATNFKGITGGDDGMTVMVAMSARSLYLSCLGISVGTIAMSYFIGKSRFGLALVSIREDEDVARSFGVKTFQKKLTAFLVAALPACLVGELYAISLAYINPGALFGVEIGLMPVTMALLGGTGLIIGPIIGTLLVYSIQELLWTQLPYLHMAIYGGMLIAIGLFLPGGLARLGAFERILGKFGLDSRIYRLGKAGERDHALA